MPVLQNAIMSGQQSAALQNARQIELAMRPYVNDYGGQYVSGSDSYGEAIQSSNGRRELFR